MDASTCPEWQYLDIARGEILDAVPLDGQVIGSIGCGKARTESMLVEQGRTVYGADISEAAIRIAASRISKAIVISQDSAMPFPAHSLDGLILADLIEHMPNAKARLKSFAGMVKPGGWILISVPNMRSVESMWQLAVRGDWPENPMGIFDETHLQFMSHKRLLRWAIETGLTFESWHDCYDYRSIRRAIYKMIDFFTLRALRSFTNFEVVGVFRNPS